MRVNASLIFSAAALGAILLVSSAGAQEQWRTPTDYRSTQLRSNNNNYSQYRGYNDDRLIAPSARPAAVQPQSQPGWSNHSDRVARMESQMESLRTTRVAELEAEIVKMNERIVASGDMLQSMGGSYGACGGCGTGCCEPCCPPVQTGFYGGIEFLFLKPHFENSTAFISSQSGNIGARSESRSHEFDYDWDAASRIVLGYTNDCGLGIRTRYFQYDHDSNRPIVNVVPGVGDVQTPAIAPILGNGQQFFLDNAAAPEFTAQHSLELQTWDFEVTNQLTFCRSLVTVGGGLRYVLMEQRYRAASQLPNGGAVSEVLTNHHDFEGIGPTLALDLLRPVSCCSGLAVYFSGRGSVLFGESNQAYTKTDPAGVFSTETYTRNGADNSLYIAELGLGVQYTRGCFFGRGGWEGQYWSGTGGPTTNDGNLGLHGLSFMLGFNY
jgi:hypothetical protein